MGPESIPAGDILPVQDTPFDFSAKGATIGSGNRLSGAIDGGGKPGVDHAFLVRRNEGETVNDSIFKEAGQLYHEGSSRKMKVSTTQPALVVYTANGLCEDGSDGIHQIHAAVCMETCQLNNAVNMIGTPGWPSKESALLAKGRDYNQVTMHEFEVSDAQNPTGKL